VSVSTKEGERALGDIPPRLWMKSAEGEGEGLHVRVGEGDSEGMIARCL
jgi:hypothetical protein